MSTQLSGVARPHSLEEFAQRQRALTEPTTSASRDLMSAAKSMLLQFDVVGLTEEMGSFERMLRARWPDMFSREGCAIPSGSEARNPTSRHTVRGNASVELDAATRNAIIALNGLDLRLYALARRVAHAQATCSTAATGTRPHSETRKCFEMARRRLRDEAP